MKAYSDWESLATGAQDACRTILNTDVAPIAMDIVKKHIQTDIYNKYSPRPNAWVNGTTYQRRGLLTKSVFYTYVSDDEILVTSDASASKPIINGYVFKNRGLGSFLSLLESGKTGVWRKGFPRPAIKNAQKEIDTSRAIKGAIRQGLIREFTK